MFTDRWNGLGDVESKSETDDRQLTSGLDAKPH